MPTLTTSVTCSRTLEDMNADQNATTPIAGLLSLMADLVDPTSAEVTQTSGDAPAKAEDRVRHAVSKDLLTDLIWRRLSQRAGHLGSVGGSSLCC